MNTYKSSYNIDCDHFNLSSKKPVIKYKEEPKIPLILISNIAYSKMMHYVDIADGEVGWLGTVEEIDEGLLISDVFLFSQNVSATHTELSPEGLSEFATEKLKEPNGKDIMNKLMFWGHSHVNMDTFASKQDDDTMDIFSTSGYDYFIRGIFNKKGSVHFTYYDYRNNYFVDDCEWNHYISIDNDIRESIEKEFDEKVETSFGSYYNGHGGYNYNNNYGGYNYNNNYEVVEYDKCEICKEPLKENYHYEVTCSKCYDKININEKYKYFLAYNEDGEDDGEEEEDDDVKLIDLVGKSDIKEEEEEDELLSEKP